MESKTPKFRVRLNLFDGIVLVLALLVGALVLWMALKPAPAPAADPVEQTPLRYTVRFQRFRESGGEMVQVGDRLMDVTKYCDLGTVVDKQVVPSQALVLNQEEQRYVLATVPDCEDILVTVETTYPENEEQILIEGELLLRVGASLYIRGEGYMASGPVVAIEREGQA